jgi:hypothetical protein
MTNTVLRLEAPEDYDLYPVFKRFNSIDREIWEVVPTYHAGALTGLPFSRSFALTAQTMNQIWNLGDIQNLANLALSTGSFYIRIQNNSGTAIRFERGGTEMITSMGVRGIPQTFSNTYSIKMERRPDGTYHPTTILQGFAVGTTQNMLPIPQMTFQIDHEYVITVSGANASLLEIVSISDGTPIDVDGVFSRN